MRKTSKKFEIGDLVMQCGERDYAGYALVIEPDWASIQDCGMEPYNEPWCRVLWCSLPEEDQDLLGLPCNMADAELEKVSA
jgi:hypothetical protein